MHYHGDKSTLLASSLKEMIALGVRLDDWEPCD